VKNRNLPVSAKISPV